MIDYMVEKQMTLEGPEDSEIAEELYWHIRRNYKNISVATVERVFKKVKGDLDQIKRDDLPETILNLGTNKYVLENGITVTVKNDISVNIKKSDMPALIKRWKELVKNKITVWFPKNTHKEQQKFLKMAKQYKYESLPSINHQTLKSHVKKLRERGDNLPDEVQVFEYKTAIIGGKNGKAH